VITTNYDLILDFLLYNRSRYGFETDIQDSSDKLRLYKLHGSLNWYTNGKDEINIIPAKEFLPDSDDVGQHGPFNLNIIYTLKKLQELNRKHKTTIIPPTWAKQLSNKNLKEVWKLAGHALSEADNIFVIGYSLPETDTFMRYFLALSAIGGLPLKRFWVFDPSPRIEKKYKELLGPGARRVYKFFLCPFSVAVKYIYKYIKPYSLMSDQEIESSFEWILKNHMNII